jgi:hypothetical protein
MMMNNGYVIFFVACLVVCVIFSIVFSTLWVHDNKSKKIINILSNSLDNKGVRNGNKSVSSDCTDVTETIMNVRPELPPSAKICLNGISYEDFTTDEKETYVFKDSHFDGTNFYDVLVPRGEYDLTVSLDKVVGVFYGIYLQFEDDMWSKGFTTTGSAKEEDDTQIIQLINDMKNKSGSGIPLIGENGNSTVLIPEFKFDTSKELEYTMRKLSTLEESKLKNVTGENLKGVLRISTGYADYHFKLNGVEKVVRVMLAPPGEMGDKTIVSNGKTKWLDFSTKTFSETRPSTASVLSFWNNYDSYIAYFPEHFQNDGDRRTTEVPNSFRTLFKEQRTGMPISISSSSIDFNNIKTSNMTLKLKVDGFIGFRSAKEFGISEEELSLNDDKMLVLYDMPDLNLKAEISFSS